VPSATGVISSGDRLVGGTGTADGPV